MHVELVHVRIRTYQAPVYFYFYDLLRTSSSYQVPGIFYIIRRSAASAVYVECVPLLFRRSILEHE